VTFRERFQAFQDWFDNQLDRISDRVEPVAERLAQRNARIEAWFEQERPAMSQAGVGLLRMLYWLAKKVGIFLLFAFFFFVIAPILILLVMLVVGIALSPLILAYLGIWWLLEQLGIPGPLRLLIVIGLTWAGIRIIRRVRAG
jgi:hypothetical protein